MKIKIRSDRDKSTDFLDKEMYYLQVFLKECKYIEKKRLDILLMT